MAATHDHVCFLFLFYFSFVLCLFYFRSVFLFPIFTKFAGVFFADSVRKGWMDCNKNGAKEVVAVCR